MSKKKSITQDENAKDVLVVTSRGITLRCKPVIALIEAQEGNIRTKYEWPDVPQRDVIGPPDDNGKPAWIEKADMNAEWVEAMGTEDDRDTWATYSAHKTQVDSDFAADLARSRVRLLATRGTEVVDGPPEEEWVGEHEWLGLNVPSDPLERRAYFFQFEALGDVQSDIFQIIKGIARASGADEEVLATIEASFRTTVERPDGADAGTDTKAAT